MENEQARDEMVDGRGGLRPHWRSLLGAFSSFGDGGLAERAKRLDRAFEEEGLSSILPGTDTTAVWRCDPVPLPIPAAEFALIESGLAQRACLLDALFDDLVGPCRTLAEAVLPPAMVFNNPGFLRLGPMPQTGGMMHLYAADLIRAPDGAWHVAADRPSLAGGIGYATENRRLLARLLPEAFRPMPVHQLSPFFDIWQDALQRLAPPRPNNTNPTIALLTPGTQNRQWFEHMYLSRELSCALVEGGDLTVRNGEVFLKTLRGLQRVDVLLRRIDGRMMDPLELETGSLIGVPGLVDAMRGGHVRVTNDPSTAIAEAPCIAAFLPALAKMLLGEPLALPSVPAMWLGAPGALDTVRRNPDAWRLRPAQDPRVEPTPAQPMPPAVQQRPADWIAVAAMPASVAPCLTPDGLRPMPVSIRVFLVNDGRGRGAASWHAMQGGLGRVLAEDGSRPARGLSKDVWVLSEDQADIVGPPAVVIAPIAIRGTAGDLPSRVADNLYWLGRTVERLDRAGRLGRAALTRLARTTGMLPREMIELQTLARCLADAGLIPPEAAEAAVTSTLADALLAAAGQGGTIQRLFRTCSRLTEGVRDRLTGDMYATFTQALRASRSEAAEAARNRRRDLDGLAHAMLGMQRFATAVAGAAAENMVRGGGFLFLDLGRRMERAQIVVGEVASALAQPPGRIEVGLRLALELCDSAITYRTRYLNVLQPAPVLHLVLADQGNPRGLAFQLVTAHTLLDELGEVGGGEGGERLAATAAGLLAEVETCIAQIVGARDQAVAAAALPAELIAMEGRLGALSNLISRRYFALLPVVQTVGLGSADVRPEAA